jgi:CO/xanthine dehydrogenase Mo-binding subunit
VAAGLRAANRSTAGYLLALADMPRIRAKTYRSLCQAFERSVADAIVIPHHDGTRGNPVIFVQRYRDREVAYAFSSGTATVQVVEIRLTDDGVRIEKSFAAVDVGIALDPRNIEGQAESAVILGLCAVVQGEITVGGGMVREAEFDDHLMMRMGQAPAIAVRIHESNTEVYGVGEAGTPTAAPALANAILAVTGRRTRELPLDRSIKFL